MRVIERKICAMVSEGFTGRAFDRRLSKRDRVVSDGKGKVEIYLWGTRVALADQQARKITLETGGHESVTTKSRLNSILWALSVDKPRISQKNFVWYVCNRDPLTNSLISKEFSSGMAFSM